MNSNPYGPPVADLTSEPIPQKEPPGIAWKIYFAIQTLRSLVGYILLFVWKRGGILIAIELILCLVATIGIGGYVFSKKILRPNLWRYFFYLYAANFVFLIVRWTFLTAEDGHFMEPLKHYTTIAGNIIGFLITVPTCIAIYKYGAPDEFLWRRENIDK